MAFVPPAYGKFGKNYKDLTKKKYDFSHSFKLVNKASGGVTFESGALNTKSGLVGSLKAKVVTKQYEVEAEAGTSASSETKATARFPRVVPGLNVMAAFSTADGAFKGQGYTTELEYSTAHLSTVHELKTNGSRHYLKSNASVGADGLAIGGQVSLDLSNGADVTDYNVGLEYTQPSYTATLLTEKKADVANLSYFHKLSPTQLVGAGVRVELSGQHNATLTVAEEVALNPSTTLKAKIEVPSSTVSASLEHRLANPQVAINVAASFNPCTLTSGQGIKCEDYGFGLTFGDY